MESLSKLRREDGVCDAYLIVGDQRIPAHRCVLVTGSDYFRARFLGPLKEVDKPDIDISSITSGAAYVEKVVDFLYEGVIDIDQKNLEPFLKIASFLLISKLREYCTEFMEKTNDVSTIVKYYLLAADYMIPDIEKRLQPTVRTRFHDWLIFDKSVLQVSPDQLQFLMQTCDVFEFCSETDILKFTIDWVKAGKTKACDDLVDELLELVKMKSRYSTNEKSNEEKRSTFEVLTSILQDKKAESEFMIKLHQALADLNIDETNADVQKSGSTSVQLDAASSSSTISVAEPMVLAISPKPCLKKALNERPQTNDSEDNKLPFKKNRAIFDICAYVPRKKAWYLLKEGQYNGLFKNIVYEEGCWYFCALFDTIYCLSPTYRCYGKEELDLISLRDFRYHTLSYHGMTLDLEPDERAFQNVCIVGDHKTVYLVSLISDIAYDLEPRYFKCFKLTPRNKWAFVFRSPTFEDDSRYQGIVSGAFSAISNEMLLIYGVVTPRSYPENRPDEIPDNVPCELFAFVAEIGNGKSLQVKVHRLSAEFHKSRSWQILQDENQFYLLEDEYTAAGFRLAYRYKYVYHSKALTSVNSNVEIVGDATMLSDDPESLYLQYKEASNDGRSVWLFSGSEEQNASILTEATIDSDGNTVVQSHKPPPFSCVTAFMAGKINSDCLAGALPVTRYLNG